MARVAIIVTCFNDGETLGETVSSIRAGAPEAELVIVDDDSTDDQTLQVLLQLEEGGVRVIHQPNGGLAAAAMAGVEATSAPYVMRFDADDLLEPGAADALAGALDREPDVAAAWGDIQTFGLTDFRVPGVPALDPWLLTYTNYISGSGVLFRREALLVGGGWELRDGFEDWDLWMKLAERGHRGVHIPQVTFHYRRDRGGLLMAASRDTARHYDDLRLRHEELFEQRGESRRESAAPSLLKILVPMTEVVPGLPRLTRINLCELFTRLLWGGGLRATVRMVRQAVSIRVGNSRGV
jgi:glycosyltransferase involved in cell wall biosynthesis